ncbi:MAG: hypothetical protein ACLGII_13780 [Gammaproteobacteria bacterium]
MTLDEYLQATEYATRRLLEAIWHEQAEIEELSSEVRTLEQAVQAEYIAARIIIDDAETPDDVMLGVGRHWENHFGPDRDRHQRQQELGSLQAKRDARAFALGSLAAGLLHIAKQGLSIAFGKEEHWPDGRLVGTQPLKAVIRGARNQALHWEAVIRNQDTITTFEKLASDFGSPFDEFRAANLAMPVVDLLAWRAYDDYVADMRCFGTGAGGQ